MRFQIFCLGLIFSVSTFAQEVSQHIIIDQFGYLPNSQKIAVIKNPKVGFDQAQVYTPGKKFALINALTGRRVFSSNVTSWSDEATDHSSGDQVWHFDFSKENEQGEYYVLDISNQKKSFNFIIADDVYNEVLKHAVRTFYYQRIGFRKDSVFAGKAWADEASHIGDLQDLNCRSFFDQDNPDTEKDVSGGWYDAGDYNKYTSWTANYVVELMKAYKENPKVWGDDYNIPESGNGVPDLLDEIKWGTDHLLRLQQEDGSVLSIVDEWHDSPPSAATGPSYYGPPNTSATLNTSAAFAISSTVFREFGWEAYADQLLEASLKAWEWADANPDSLFNNNHKDFSSLGLGAGRMEVSSYSRRMIKLEAACFLFEATEREKFKEYFDGHFSEANLIRQGYSNPFQTHDQEVLLYYSGLRKGTKGIKDAIKRAYLTTILFGEDNLLAHRNNIDPYFAYIKAYTWGSNGTKSAQGNMYMDILSYQIQNDIEDELRTAANSYLHYIHGVNPLNMVYLSNMYDYGGDKCVNEFYHAWFCNGSEKWDRVGESTYGPPPGYLTGGANPRYNWDRCCPEDCDTEENNALCFEESIEPPRNQPDQKSYKDFNTSWPLNSWEITENSCSYQTKYIRLLSKFVKAN
ncbi:glycoside hydrolase family 9 protein [Bacteroidota bacterium]